MRQTLIAFIRSLKKALVENYKNYNQKLPYIIVVIVALIIVVTSINLFIELTDTLKTDILANFDKQITDYVISLRSPALTNYFVFITNIGDLYGYLAVLTIILFDFLVRL